MPLPAEKSYTYADVLEWEDVRYELYNGQPVALASPSSVHQEILAALLAQIHHYLAGKKCKVYPAPFDVRLFEEKDDLFHDVFTVVQPDISVICDSGKTDSHGCKGAPDLIIEVLSPSTARYDRQIKFNLYQRAGVREYWIVDPATGIVSVYTLEEGAYHAAAAYPGTASVPVGVLEGCEVDLTAVFPQSENS